MASDVKIGLLLGLAFLFVISFTLNGLLHSDSSPESSDPIPVVVNDPPGIVPEVPPKVLRPECAPEKPIRESTPPLEDKERFRSVLLRTTSLEEIDKNIEPVGPALSVVYYVVCKGDNLADIAKKFYGPEEGNRIANVKRIFEANRRLLDSPDKIYPGQKLIIPPLWALDPDKNGIEGIFPDSMFEEVDSIGRRHL
ncbi:MAG: LysM peptidoglycan-binding domain-containing protein [Planctomycetota bacterium]|jgi:hypothetical protein